ncbi:MAG TPA: hypothetical protein VIQ03_02320 [Gammaproteobacteria bacterium]
MNKLTLAVVLGMGMSLPLGAMASTDEEVTIRVMQMNENSSENVTRYIELPDAASDEAQEQAQSSDRNRERVRERENQQDPDAVQDHIMEQTQEMEQDRERMMEHENLEGGMPDGQGGPGSGDNGPM